MNLFTAAYFLFDGTKNGYVLFDKNEMKGKEMGVDNEIDRIEHFTLSL